MLQTRHYSHNYNRARKWIRVLYARTSALQVQCLSPEVERVPVADAGEEVSEEPRVRSSPVVQGVQTTGSRHATAEGRHQRQQPVPSHVVGGDRREGEVRGLSGDDTDDGQQTGGAEKERYGCCCGGGGGGRWRCQGPVCGWEQNKTEPVCSSGLYQSQILYLPSSAARKVSRKALSIWI